MKAGKKNWIYKRRCSAVYLNSAAVFFNLSLTSIFCVYQRFGHLLDSAYQQHLSNSPGVACFAFEMQQSLHSFKVAKKSLAVSGLIIFELFGKVLQKWPQAGDLLNAAF
ncbi:hypothetical protein BH10BAC3_BH10BAC3_26930 [soil metagenome]